MVEEALPLRTADQSDFQRPHRGQRSLDRRGVAELQLRHAPVEDRIIDDFLARLRQLDVPRPMERQHETATDLIAKLPVGLDPVPYLADSDGKSVAA
jgi:hypothetical protein